MTVTPGTTGANFSVFSFEQLFVLKSTIYSRFTYRRISDENARRALRFFVASRYFVFTFPLRLESINVVGALGFIDSYK